MAVFRSCNLIAHKCREVISLSTPSGFVLRQAGIQRFAVFGVVFAGGQFGVAHGGEVASRPGIALFGGEFVPFRGGGEVGLGAEAVLVHDTQIGLCLVVAGLRDFGEAGERLFVLALVIVADALVEHGVVVAGRRCGVAGNESCQTGDAGRCECGADAFL